MFGFIIEFLAPEPRGRSVRNHRREHRGAPGSKTHTWVADGEDVAICTAEVQDAQGRVLPITGHDITFKLTGG